MTYKGKGSWEAFIFQFDRTAGRCHWTANRKREKLLDCLEDDALTYIQKQGAPPTYDELRALMAQRFMSPDSASVARKQLHLAKQREDESLEAFSQRVHFLTLDGHPDAGENAQQQIAVEAFLIGAKDKRAAEAVMDKEPRTIYEAQKLLKTSINNHKALFGSRPAAQRHVAFIDSAEEDGMDVRSAVRPGSTQAGGTVAPQFTDEMKKMWEEMGAMLKRQEEGMRKMQEEMAVLKRQTSRPMTSSSRFSSPPPSPRSRSPGSPRGRGECYHCHEPGHFRHECPKLKSSPTTAQTSLQLECSCDKSSLND